MIMTAYVKFLAIWLLLWLALFGLESVAMELSRLF